MAGFVGAMMGVGGGIVVVPVLVTLLDVPLRLAIGASMVGVVATSSAAAAVFIRDGLSNIRLGILLSQVTVVGALAGVLVGRLSGGRVVTGVFAGVLVFAAWVMMRRRKDRAIEPSASGELEKRWRLTGAYRDGATGREVRYGIVRVMVGLPAMILAGMASGMLGVGGGIFQVPIMDAVMYVPIKAATATSNFMMGITAAAGAVAFFAMGEIEPVIAAPVVTGVFFGSVLGSRVMPRVADTRLRLLFVGGLLFLAGVMAWRALTGDV
ncbi:MAG: sulfite exporter TauE/SafE family protein [Deltaproteobacteria bacterium]|nr:sulfite exporter TauE/SafE family protein [Deltaproteobacteria bacterium]